MEFEFHKGDHIMTAYKGLAYMPIMEITKVYHTFFAVKSIEVDNNWYQTVGEEFIFPRAFEGMLLKVKISGNKK